MIGILVWLRVVLLLVFLVFKDEWTAALHDANMALEYEISGSWYGPNKIFAFPANWLSIGITLPPLYEKPAPIR